jgi:hypothetical protein
VRHLDDARTVIDGTSRAYGLLAVLGGMGMSGLLLVPFSCGVLVGLSATLLCAAVGAGYGYRLRIAQEGVTIWRTWFGVRLPTSRERLELDARIGVDFDDDDAFAGVSIGEHALPVPARDREALKEAILMAIEAAVAVSIAARAGWPYRSRPQR